MFYVVFPFFGHPCSSLRFEQVHELEAEMDGLNKPHSQFSQVRVRGDGARSIPACSFSARSVCRSVCGSRVYALACVLSRHHLNIGCHCRALRSSMEPAAASVFDESIDQEGRGMSARYTAACPHESAVVPTLPARGDVCIVFFSNLVAIRCRRPRANFRLRSSRRHSSNSNSNSQCSRCVARVGLC